MRELKFKSFNIFKLSWLMISGIFMICFILNFLMENIPILYNLPMLYTPITYILTTCFVGYIITEFIDIKDVK